MTDRIAVVGAGQMGNGIAHVFAQLLVLDRALDVRPRPAGLVQYLVFRLSHAFNVLSLVCQPLVSRW